MHHVNDVVLEVIRGIAANISGIVVEWTDEVDAVIQINFNRQTITTQLEPACIDNPNFNSNHKNNIITTMLHDYDDDRGLMIIHVTIIINICSNNNNCIALFIVS